MKKYTEYTIEELKEMTREVNGYDGSLEDFEYYEMEEIDEVLHGVEVLEILRMAHFGEFIWSDDYFTVNAYGNLESINEFEFEKVLKDNQNEIIAHYNELVESGEIENIL